MPWGLTAGAFYSYRIHSSCGGAQRPPDAPRHGVTHVGWGMCVIIVCMCDSGMLEVCSWLRNAVKRHMINVQQLSLFKFVLLPPPGSTTCLPMAPVTGLRRKEILAGEHEGVFTLTDSEHRELEATRKIEALDASRPRRQCSSSGSSSDPA